MMVCSCCVTPERALLLALSKLPQVRLRFWRLAAIVRDYFIERSYQKMYLYLYRLTIFSLENQYNILYSHFQCHSVCHFLPVPCILYRLNKPVLSTEIAAIVGCMCG